MAKEIRDDQLIENDDAALIKKYEDWFSESRTFFAGQRERWRKNEKLYRNEVEIGGLPQNTKLMFNLALSNIETQMPIISDFMPTFDVMPVGNNDIHFADMMQKRKAQVEKDSKFKEKTLAAAHDSLIYSNGLTSMVPKMEKVSIDDKGIKAGQDGYNEETAEVKDLFTGIDIRPVDPYTWFPSPDAVGLEIKNDEAMYHIFATPIHVDIIEQKYNKKVEAEGNMDEFRSFVFNTDNSGGYNNSSGNSSERGGNGKEALVKECYTMSEDVSKYPNGRVTVWANNVLLLDEPLEFPRIPYFMIANYKTSHSLFGIGETELMRTQIKCVNHVMSSLADNINKTGNPIKKITHGLWSKMYGKIKGIPNETILVDKDDDVSWLIPPNVPAYTFNFIEILLRLTDVVTGIHDVLEGRKPAGVTAASAITALQEASQARVRYKIANEITSYIEDMGKFFIWILQNFDEEAKSLRQEDVDDQGKPVFIEFDPGKLLDKNGIAEGEQDFDEQSSQSLRDSNFDIEVVSGVRLPAGRLATEERATNLFEKGIYGIKQVVTALAEPNRQEVIDQYNQNQGIQDLVEKQEARNEAFAQFEQLISMALENPNEWIGSPEEEQLSELLIQFKEFFGADGFKKLPQEFQERLVAGLMATEEDQQLTEQQ